MQMQAHREEEVERDGVVDKMMQIQQRIGINMGRDVMEVESPKSGMSSPEAKLGMQVEDLWDIQEPQLSPTDKLNACFESIPVSSFPPAAPSQVVEITSNATIAEAVELLSKHKILSVPIVDVNAPAEASWMDRYIGIVEFAGIVVWILHQAEKKVGSPRSSSPSDGSDGTVGPAVAAAVSGLISPRYRSRSSNPFSDSTTSGDFFKDLTSSEIYKYTKVSDISGTFRWAPFLALQKSNSFLTMLLLLSKYRMKSIPVVDLGEGGIDNIITQSAVIHMLAECSGLQWFETLGSKKLHELGLPLMKSGQVVKIHEDEPVLKAFKLMGEQGVGAVPVVDEGGEKAVGNISLIQFLLTAPEIYKDFSSITAKNFIASVRSYLVDQIKVSSPLLGNMVTCNRNNTLKEVIATLDTMKIHRIYVADDNGKLEGVITLRDIISKLVHEPRGYFGDFFDGVLPTPVNSRV